MQRLKTSALLQALIIVLIALLSSVHPAARFSPSTTRSVCDSMWRIVQSPNVGSLNTDFYGLAAIAPNDLWAVGLSYPNRVLSPSHTVTEHWNGERWSIIKSPNVGAYSNHLYGAAADASNDVWAVGDYSIDQRGSGGKTLVEHWDGSQWSVVKSPNPGNRFSELLAVAAVSVNDAWAVGNVISLNPVRNETLIEHWNGSEWNVITSPNPGAASNELSAITVISASDVWAVGNDAQSNGHDMTLTEHWNGSMWSVVKSPNVGRFPNDLDAVSAASANDVWAVGSHGVSPGDIDDTLTEHWNGSQWSVVKSPNPAAASNILLGAAAVASNNVWAVGYAYGFNTSPVTTLIEHWNGRAWAVIKSPNRQPPSDSLSAVAALSPQNIWAIGSHLTPGLTFQTLSEHSC